MATFIDYLSEQGLVVNDLVIVGHSLGAHVSGYAGKHITSGKIGVIIGLDPAGPLFSVDKPHKRLADTDADYVQVIHTDAGNLSLEGPIGHADFYPNGGNEQPGCTKGNALTSYLSKILSYRTPTGQRNIHVFIYAYQFFCIYREVFTFEITCILFGESTGRREISGYSVCII